MANNTWTVVFICFFLILISVVAGDLGITSDWIEAPDAPEAPEGGFFEALTGLVTWTFNTVGSFIQLLTFQADLPTTINTLIMLPLTFGIFYLVVVIIRGGAG